MSRRDRIVWDVRQLIEQQYLESIGDRSKHEFAELSETEKREILKAFLQKLTAGSEAEPWVKVLQDIV
jgi:hypothetical protein